MGIPGLLKEIGKGDRVALAKLAIDHFEKHQRPLRIAIDAAIWNFQTQSSQGGKNPALRTLFYRLLKLLALPIHPVFVYDGKNKPLTKRGKTVSRYGTCVPNELSKNLVARFQFPHHTAPGEAEAECAFLQRNGIVDAVMSQDVDAIMFGSTLTLRDWSKEGTKGNKAPTHVNVFEHGRVREVSGLDASGMVLVALLSGGDYHEGVQGFGPGLACQIAKAGFGEELVSIVQAGDEEGLKDWRERLQYELESNESGYFLKRHRTVKIPETFPDRTILSYYLTPAVSDKGELKRLDARWKQWWEREIDVPALREYTAMTFDWLYKGGARKYVRCLAQPLFQHRLKRKQICAENYSVQDITERRNHFVTDGIPELRLAAVPASVVGIDLEAEEDNPEFADLDLDEDAESVESTVRETSVNPVDEPSSPSKRKKRPPWDPYKPEKWWIPEMLLKTGISNVVGAWHEEQLNIRADPLRFATRKCRPVTKAKGGKKIDHSIRDGAIQGFLPPTDFGGVNVPSQAKKPLERAKTDTTLLRCSQQENVGTFFKPSKSSKTGIFLTADSQVSTIGKSKQRVDSDSDDGFDVDFLDLLHKPPKSTHSWLTRSKDHQDFVDAASSPSITHRKKKPQKTPSDTNDDIVFVGSKPLPLSIASFFGHNRNLKLSPVLNHQSSASVESSRFQRQDLERVGNASADLRDRKGLPMSNELLNSDEVAVMSRTVTTCQPPEQDDQIMAIDRSQVELVKPHHKNAVRKVAMLRESLPGTWREMPLTPSQNSGVAFIDLTNT